MLNLTLRFPSSTLGLQTSLSALIPEGPSPAGGWPLLYLLHGLSDDDSAWLRWTSIERYAGDRGIAVVMPQVHRSFYCDEVHGYKFWTFLTEELPTLVGTLLPVAADRDRTFVAGLSMGGYGAMKWALRQPERFVAAASLSGALDKARLPETVAAYRAAADFFAANGATPASVAAFAAAVGVPVGRVHEQLLMVGGIDNPGLVARIRERLEEERLLVDRIWGDVTPVETTDDVFHLAATVGPAGLPRLFVTCGRGDDLYPMSRDFAALADGRGLDLTAEFHPGGHDWAYWDAHLPRVLDFLLDAAGLVPVVATPPPGFHGARAD